MTKKTGRTQRLPRSSRTPGLRLPPAKNAATVSATVTDASATSAGWEKKAANPPLPRTARPRYAAVPRTIKVSLATVFTIVPTRGGAAVPVLGSSLVRQHPAPEILRAPDAGPEALQLDDLAVVHEQVHLRP